MRHPFDPCAPVMAQLRQIGLPERLPRDRVLVYRFLHGDDLLYVGVTCSPRGRFVGHRRASGWWLLVTHLLLEWHPDERSALASEVTAIKTERPGFNIRSAGKLTRGSCASQTLLMRNVPLSLSRSRSRSLSTRRPRLLHASSLCDGDQPASMHDLAPLGGGRR